MQPNHPVRDSDENQREHDEGRHVHQHFAEVIDVHAIHAVEMLPQEDGQFLCEDIDHGEKISKCLRNTKKKNPVSHASILQLIDWLIEHQFNPLVS